jgi:excisionase family DNA binding protein
MVAPDLAPLAPAGAAEADGMSGIDLHLDDDGVERLAAAIARRLQGRLGAGGTPWLNADEAAAYIGAPISRIRQLTMGGEIPVHRDGRRVLYHRDELDRWLLDGGM